MQTHMGIPRLPKMVFMYTFKVAKRGPLNTWPLKDAVRAAFLPSSNYSYLHTSDLGDDVGNSL